MRIGLVNARILTMDEGAPTAEAILIDGDRIARVGTRSDVMPLADQVVEMEGRTILPGFIDAHVHVVWTGMALDAVDLVGVRQMDGIIGRLREAARTLPKGEWIFGNGYDRSIIEGHGSPTRTDLDRASADHPILIRARGGHCCVVNTPALSLIKPDTGAADGILTGEANRRALAVTGRWLDDCRRLEAARRCGEFALSKGVTAIHAMQRVSDRRDEFVLKLRDGEFGPRLVVYPTTTDIAWVVDRGFRRIGGCLLIDGGIEAHTAAVFGAYADRPETSGRLHFSDGELVDFFEKAGKAGLQTAVHAIGDRAIAQVLDAHESVLQRTPGLGRGLRHRIEHFVVPREPDVKRTGELGVAVCAQPAFESFWGGRHGWFARFLGQERMARSTPLRSMLSNGISVAGGSDSYVTPIDPLLGIQAAVLHPNEAERIPVAEAIRLFTLGAAEVGRQEGEVGSITEGKYADLVVLSNDPRESEAGRLKDIGVEQTWIHGAIVWPRGK